ncbi:peptide deformylase [Schwartzia succinivorans]|jgi:peptide deformylase|uniref:Peptide deformylase n=1 Tax=Schwartzia succinivorans DSM 10502 TaxID=1123243 RepID=A0A1M4WF20_9FIRM|nr:peptide deformylase [Schwartzia succinivorans]MBQ1918130.1 peptide deformylase [Schwartzia sp. (in: firmicutes)]MBE6096483.1 peptide deformylase [Schwartzia succinivorans]MBQ3863037.1 peptide deformylase [Schwartzia sp. (in: firmicutes)]MBQ5413088.1 peptide deformylase [Schwartzia sp. (in: firmicutes)]SHE79849.1 peptide deformylase [Schwartzia succinivorans DSM 10502]
MALLDIKKAGAPVLKEVCAPVQRVDAKLKALLDDMAETMYKSNGIGLAAPQIGKAIRVVVIDVGEGLIEMINPLITHREGKVIDSEGCLSVPNIFGDVERAEKVTVEFTNRFGKRKKLKAEQLLARCIQHELDHLDGVLFIDIAKSLRQEAANE